MTDKLRAAAQQMLEAVADLTILTPREWQAVHGLKIDALRAALAEPARMTPAELADRLKRGEKWQLAEQPAEQKPVAWRRRERGGEWQYFGWHETGMTHELVARCNKDGFECEAIPAPQPAIPLPEHETEAMHDAVMAVIYQGVTRANTDALWQAYRRAILAAAPETPQPAKPVEQCWKCGDLDPAGHAKCNVPACGMREDTQPAKREPLTRDQVKAMLAEAGYKGAAAQHRADFINGLRHGERAHGIGGQP